MDNENLTRGRGLLEGFLARRRATLANKLIPDYYRTGRMLDIGCGVRPYALLTIPFSEKYGIDQAIDESAYKDLEQNNIFIRNITFDETRRLPFPGEYMDIITMLAVLEHVEPADAPVLMGEAYRILRKGGFLILTTPPPWTDRLLRVMAAVGLVSTEEISDHKAAYVPAQICVLLEQSGFSRNSVRNGYFEFGMNIWVKVEK